MRTDVIASLGVALLGSALLGGCASLTAPRQPQYAHYIVPCDTPGAIRAHGTPPTPASSLAADPAPEAVNPRAPPPGNEPICIVAALRAPAYATGRYYSSGYLGRGYYARPYYGTGLGFHGGGHGRAHSGGHHGGGHGGGGRH